MKRLLTLIALAAAAALAVDARRGRHRDRIVWGREADPRLRACQMDTVVDLPPTGTIASATCSPFANEVFDARRG